MSPGRDRPTIGSSFPKAYTVPADTRWGHSIQEPRPGIYVRPSWTRAVWGCKGGSSPNGLLQFSLATAGPPPGPMTSLDPLPQRTRRKGEGAEDDEAGKQAFPFLLEAGQAEVGPCLCFFVPMCPSSLPCSPTLSLSFRSRLLLATAHKHSRPFSKDLIEI